jgi:hypothetical protein
MTEFADNQEFTKNILINVPRFIKTIHKCENISYWSRLIFSYQGMSGSNCKLSFSAGSTAFTGACNAVC